MIDYTLEQLLCCIHERLSLAQKEIFEELKRSINERVVTLKGKSQGIKRNNDYRAYFWIKVLVGKNMYWITLFYNDVDDKSGNPHTQIGRIQFWKNIRNWENGIGSPHIKDSNTGRWCFCSENAFDPKQKIDDTDFSACKVVNEFLNYLELNGEKNVRG